jgi:spore maturation protein SpmA
MSALDTASGQKDFDHASYKALILLHNPVYKLTNVLAQILNFNIPALCINLQVTTIIKHRKQDGPFCITIVVTDIALTANMGAIIEIYCSRIVSHHKFTHSAMEAQSVYIITYS